MRLKRSDKNGKRLKIGDFVGQITSFGENLGGCYVILTNDPGRYINYVEKLPKNEKKREQIVLLKKFEGCHTIIQQPK
jgi:hypothetical protein